MGCFRHLSRGPTYIVTLSALLMGAAMAFAEDAGAPPAPQPASPAAITPPKAPPPATPASSLTPKQEADGILGKKVFSADGADMGLVTNVLVDSKGHPIAVVVDFGGFLGVGTRKIAIDWHVMQFRPGDKNKPVTLSLQKEQLRAAPEYKPGKGLHIVGAPTPSPVKVPAPAPAASAPDDKNRK